MCGLRTDTPRYLLAEQLQQVHTPLTTVVLPHVLNVLREDGVVVFYIHLSDTTCRECALKSKDGAG